MGIWDRLGNVLKSYINDGAERVFGEERSWRSHEDDDLNAAYEELDDFLRGGKTEDETGESGKKNHSREKPNGQAEQKGSRSVPPELRGDFAELGLSPGASEEECKEAYKKLLKIHHPDRHGRDPELLKKNTEKAARINAAYDRLVHWHKTGSVHK